MLYEFAITPQSLGDAKILLPDIQAGMTAFIRHLTVFNARHRVVISDVCEGKLSRYVRELHRNTPKGTDHFKLIEEFLKYCEGQGVWRPATESDAEADYIKSAKLKPAANKIIASSVDNEVFAWKQAKDVDFYSGLSDASLPTVCKGDRDAQLDWLHPILIHADFIVLMLPYFYVDKNRDGGDMCSVSTLFRRP
jgi:hypothetical protein